jgi:hypothetical protein
MEEETKQTRTYPHRRVLDGHALQVLRDGAQRLMRLAPPSFPRLSLCV